LKVESRYTYLLSDALQGQQVILKAVETVDPPTDPTRNRQADSPSSQITHNRYLSAETKAKLLDVLDKACLAERFIKVWFNILLADLLSTSLKLELK
jgi:hypothetical protein